MANKHKIAEPIYQKIAVDIASKIAAGKYKVGEKIYGRSMLAAHYAVSPETIRRAMFMLQDVGIVAIESGSGSVVLSAERAAQLVGRFRNISTITELKKNIETLSEQQKKQQDDILDNVHQLLEYIEKFRLASPILPYEIKITRDCRFLGKMISELLAEHRRYRGSDPQRRRTDRLARSVRTVRSRRRLHHGRTGRQPQQGAGLFIQRINSFS